MDKRIWVTDGEGKPYLSVVPLENFTYRVKRTDSYSGKGYPFRFTVTALSNDSKTGFYYHSPVRYRQDSRYLPNAENEGKLDGIGNILKTFVGVESYIQNFVTPMINKYADFTLINQLYPDVQGVDQEHLENRERELLRENMPQNEILDFYYHRHLRAVYRYSRNGHQRIRVCEANMVAIASTCVRHLPGFGREYQQPRLNEKLKRLYPNAFYYEGGFYDPYMKKVDWSVNHRYEMDCLESEIEKYFPAIFNSLSDWESNYSPEITEEMRRLQEIVDSENAMRFKRRIDENRVFNRVDYFERQLVYKKEENERLLKEKLKSREKMVDAFLNGEEIVPNPLPETHEASDFKKH